MCVKYTTSYMHFLGLYNDTNQNVLYTLYSITGTFVHDHPGPKSVACGGFPAAPVPKIQKTEETVLRGSFSVVANVHSHGGLGYLLPRAAWYMIHRSQAFLGRPCPQNPRIWGDSYLRVIWVVASAHSHSSPCQLTQKWILN